MKTPLLVIFTAALAACGVRGPERSAQSAQPASPPPVAHGSPGVAQTPCDVKGGDSAYAVCWATRPDRAGDPPRRVYEIVRRADTLCITTLPGDRRVVDGVRRTKVLFTAVVENIESDSIGCR